MEAILLLFQFVSEVREDPRISSFHISVYVALLYYSVENKTGPSFTVFSRDILPLAKLSRAGTYHQIMRDLSEGGYIRYIPSHSSVLGSLVELVMDGSKGSIPLG